MSNLEQAEWVRTLQKIDSLERCEGFEWFMQKIRDKADDLADQVLHDEMPAEGREKLRQQRIAMMEVLRFVGDAKNAAHQALGA